MPAEQAEPATPRVGSPAEQKRRFEEERLNTNIRRMYWFAVYIIVLQATLIVLNYFYPQDSPVATTLQVPSIYYVYLSYFTLGFGVFYWALLGLARLNAIKNSRFRNLLVYSLLYFYCAIQMAFCTIGILNHEGINAQLILILMVAMVPMLPPRESIRIIGATAAYVLVLMLVTQSNLDSQGYSQWHKFFMSDMRAYFFVTNVMTMLISSLIYRLYEENSQLVDQLTGLSETDSLTGLLNRRKFDEVIDLEWRRSSRARLALTLIIFDIDYFKEYNDNYGHIKGDECLALLGTTLRRKFRRAGEYVARTGGEEFALLITGSQPNDDVLACEYLLEALRDSAIPHEFSEVSQFLTVSAGSATMVPHDGFKLEDFINAADRALYEAKDSGRNRYIIANIQEQTVDKPAQA